MKTAFPLPQREKIGVSGKKKRIIVISGPTATGKTHLSLTLAKAIGGEIVSADSAQIYRGMDIGTAKATSQERALVPHHLIDVREIDEPYNVAEFYYDSQEALKEIFAKECVPIVVGGSVFYIRTLLYGPPAAPPSVPDIRDQLEGQMRKLGPDVLYERLQMLDPEYAATISERDRHKIIRALEIIAISEKKVSDFPKQGQQESMYDFRCWFLYYPKEILNRRIDERCDFMLENGFLEEVKKLDERGIRLNSAASQAIGYRQALAYLDSGQTEQDYRTFVAEFKRASRQYSKRQFTWFRKEPLFRWVNLSEHPKERLIEHILQDFEQG